MRTAKGGSALSVSATCHSSVFSRETPFSERFCIPSTAASFARDSLLWSRLHDVLVFTAIHRTSSGGFFRSRLSPSGTLAWPPCQAALPCFLLSPSLASLRNRGTRRRGLSLKRSRPDDSALSYAFGFPGFAAKQMRPAGEVSRSNPAKRMKGADGLKHFKEKLS